MARDKEGCVDVSRLPLVVTVIWFFLSLPMAEHFYDEVFDGGIFVRLFSLAFVTLPVWSVWGWKWMTHGVKVGRWVWGAYFLFCALLLSLFLAERQLNELVYLPFLFFAVFALQVMSFDGLPAPVVWVWGKAGVLKRAPKKYYLSAVAIVGLVALAGNAYEEHQSVKRAEKWAKEYRVAQKNTTANRFVPLLEDELSTTVYSEDEIKKSQSYIELLLPFTKQRTSLQTEELKKGVEGKLVRDTGVVSSVRSAYLPNFAVVTLKVPVPMIAIQEYSSQQRLSQRNTVVFEVRKKDAVRLNEGASVEFTGRVSALKIDYSGNIEMRVSSVVLEDAE
ncbi:MAG: hypothetical protein OXT65_07445 [Alphaproteobacteria bacterium]|nr:hypothetical protein [Alphaproteobacteria bacterium]